MAGHRRTELIRINNQDFRLGHALSAPLVPDQVHQFKQDGVFPFVVLYVGVIEHVMQSDLQRFHRCTRWNRYQVTGRGNLNQLQPGNAFQCPTGTDYDQGLARSHCHQLNVTESMPVASGYSIGDLYNSPRAVLVNRGQFCKSALG